MSKCLQNASGFVIGKLEDFFYWWGKIVTSHPIKIILTCLLVTFLAGLGFLNFSQEHKANLLWIPPESSYNVHEKWLDNNFKRNKRDQLIIYTADNVLTPKAIQEMFELHKSISNITVDGKTFNDLCMRVPIADIYHSTARKKREAIKPEDTVESNATYEDYVDDWYGYDYVAPVQEDEVKYVKPRINYAKFGRGKTGHKTVLDKNDYRLPDDIYCDLLSHLDSLCLQSNLLDIWRYKEDLIATVTQQEIIDAVNLLSHSPWLSYPLDYPGLLGGKVYNSTGHIVAAKTVQLYWSLQIPDDIEEVASIGVEVEHADNVTLEWEAKMLEVTLNTTFEGVTLYVNAGRSFSDVSADAIFFDGIKMVSGYLLMFAYTILMLGRLNKLEVRIYLAITGLTCIGMGMIIAMGITLAIGYPYTPMHAALPFIALGIGIDDMFVLVQCWMNLERDDDYKHLPLKEAMGRALKTAGVAITITTLTDVFAFAVGSVTNMPGLESFCITTSICLSSIYLLVLTWFTAFLSIDQKRIAAGRNSFLPCFVHKESKPSWLSQLDLPAKFMLLYSKFLDSWLFRSVVMLITFSFLAIGIWGSVIIKQKFDPVLLLPSDSYLRSFIAELEESYPSNGWQAEVYTGRLDYSNMAAMEALINQLQGLADNKTHLRSVNSWWVPMKKFASAEMNFTTWEDFANPDDFPMVLSEFLNSADGSIFQSNFRWESEFLCRQPAPSILASKFGIEYLHMSGPEQHVPAKQTVERIVNESGVSENAFSHVKIYAAWETDEIIGFEMWRNIGMSMACVMVVTLLLLVNVQMSFYVFLCVISTLADIVGFLHFWNMTIDIITCVNIVLAIGLCVDYSVHIAHAYLVAKGSRVERSVQAIENIGPAVFNGGTTTLLAIFLLGFSTSQIFLTFFKVFLLTVLFGLWHGLVAFPVLLSVLGPNASHDDNDDSTLASDKSPDSVSSTDSGLPSSIADSQSSESEATKDSKTSVTAGTRSNSICIPLGFFNFEGEKAPYSQEAEKLKAIFKRKSSFCLEQVMKL